MDIIEKNQGVYLSCKKDGVVKFNHFEANRNCKNVMTTAVSGNGMSFVIKACSLAELSFDDNSDYAALIQQSMRKQAYGINELRDPEDIRKMFPYFN